MARETSAQRPVDPATQHHPQGGRVDWPTELARHERWLRTVVFARVGEAAATDDVMQEVAVAAVEKGDQLRDAAKVGPWLYRLAVMAALQYRRRQGRRRKLMERFSQRRLATEVDAREVDPLEWLLVDERKAMVRQTLQQLPTRDAEILLLKYTEDWSYRELAEHLGLSTSAVEARLHRARARMRRELMRVDPSLMAAVSK
jgi:RNA polymerase sigma factor (sigma-70 family)